MAAVLERIGYRDEPDEKPRRKPTREPIRPTLEMITSRASELRAHYEFQDEQIALMRRMRELQSTEVR